MKHKHGMAGARIPKLMEKRLAAMAEIRIGTIAVCTKVSSVKAAAASRARPKATSPDRAPGGRTTPAPPPRAADDAI
jgi:hypothetical protein